MFFVFLKMLKVGLWFLSLGKPLLRDGVPQRRGPDAPHPELSEVRPVQSHVSVGRALLRADSASAAFLSARSARLTPRARGPGGPCPAAQGPAHASAERCAQRPRVEQGPVAVAVLTRSPGTFVRFPQVLRG